jgi:pimeloyl-ACP methyl ester carboxylesterase
VRLLYQPAIRAWKARGFAVHVFPYDWRQRLGDSADRFHHYLGSLLVGRRDKRLALVGHGLGGLVACTWALKQPGWSDFVTRAIFAGVPLHGCSWPVEAITGDLPLFRNLALVDPSNDLDELRSMAASFPGWTAMLPDPAVFPDAERYYSRSYWPDGVAPSQRDLDESRNAKLDLPHSPLLRRAAIVEASDDVDAFTSPETIQAIADILCGMSPASPASAAAAAQPAPSIAEPVVPAGLQQGQLGIASLRWLIGYTSRVR